MYSSCTGAPGSAMGRVGDVPRLVRQAGNRWQDGALSHHSKSIVIMRLLYCCHLIGVFVVVVAVFNIILFILVFIVINATHGYPDTQGTTAACGTWG